MTDIIEKENAETAERNAVNKIAEILRTCELSISQTRRAGSNGLRNADSIAKQIYDALNQFPVEEEWQKTPPPKDKDFYMRCEHIMPCRWKPYKPQARKQCYPEGRWQVMNEYGGWDNYDGEIDEWKDEITC